MEFPFYKLQNWALPDPPNAKQDEIWFWHGCWVYCHVVITERLSNTIAVTGIISIHRWLHYKKVIPRCQHLRCRGKQIAYWINSSRCATLYVWVRVWGMWGVNKISIFHISYFCKTLCITISEYFITLADFFGRLKHAKKCSWYWETNHFILG